jgi:hypothetical protein
MDGAHAAHFLNTLQEEIDKLKHYTLDIKS